MLVGMMARLILTLGKVVVSSILFRKWLLLKFLWDKCTVLGHLSLSFYLLLHPVKREFVTGNEISYIYWPIDVS
jgi:hypothetical protein